MEPMHTPGPWRIGKTRKGKTSIDCDGWWSMAKVVTRLEGCREPFAEGMANLRLIAAAPDLLDLAMMVAFDSDGYTLEELRDAANAAIAKALGHETANAKSEGAEGGFIAEGSLSTDGLCHND